MFLNSTRNGLILSKIWIKK